MTHTVSHLLHHTSGLSEAGFVSILPRDASIEDAVRALKTAVLTAPVGTQHQYFNLGYVVLALSAFHARNVYRLKGWREGARYRSPVKRGWDVAIQVRPTIPRREAVLPVEGT